MSAHRRVSRRVCGWRMESGLRRSCGRVLVGSNAARIAFELAGVSSLRPLFWREREREERMDVSTASGVSPWRLRGRWELTSGSRNDVLAPNVAVVLSPVGHVDELGSDSDIAMVV